MFQRALHDPLPPTAHMPGRMFYRPSRPEMASIQLARADCGLLPEKGMGISSVVKQPDWRIIQNERVVALPIQVADDSVFVMVGWASLDMGQYPR